jgi:hypothetical protein
MEKGIKKYFNIYMVLGLIAVSSVLYIFSFAFVLNDVAGGSSREMKKKYCEKNPQECNVSIKRDVAQKK